MGLEDLCALRYSWYGTQLIYTGKIMPIEGYPDLGASTNIILRLSQVVQPNMKHIFYFDNWFTSVNLLVQLAKKEIFAIATARSNCLLGCEMQSEKEVLKKKKLQLMVL